MATLMTSACSVTDCSRLLAGCCIAGAVVSSFTAGLPVRTGSYPVGRGACDARGNQRDRIRQALIEHPDRSHRRTAEKVGADPRYADRSCDEEMRTSPHFSCTHGQPRNSAICWAAKHESPAQKRGRMGWPRCLAGGAENTQIYEGTNQIQRMVMARQLLK